MLYPINHIHRWDPQHSSCSFEQNTDLRLGKLLKVPCKLRVLRGRLKIWLSVFYSDFVFQNFDHCRAADQTAGEEYHYRCLHLSHFLELTISMAKTISNCKSYPVVCYHQCGNAWRGGCTVKQFMVLWTWQSVIQVQAIEIRLLHSSYKVWAKWRHTHGYILRQHLSLSWYESDSSRVFNFGLGNEIGDRVVKKRDEKLCLRFRRRTMLKQGQYCSFPPYLSLPALVLNSEKHPSHFLRFIFLFFLSGFMLIQSPCCQGESVYESCLTKEQLR